MRAFLITVLSGTALFAQTPPPATKAAPKAPAKTTTPGTKTGAPAATRPNPLLNPAGLRAIAPPVFRVKFTTTKGDFVVEVTRALSPLGADRFYNLVRNRFFTDVAFFRAIPNFMVQFGMSPNPAISKAWEEATIKDEPVKQGNKKGVLTFAKTGAPNSRSTQFFINIKDNDYLDADGFSGIGTVTEGMEVVLGIYTGYGDTPDQNLIRTQGKAYLDKSFPRLDSIKSAVVIFPEPPAPGTKAAPATKTGTTPATKTGAPAATKTGTTPPATKKATPPPAPEKK